MSKESIQQACLRHARDLAGGYSRLSHAINVRAVDLQAMVEGREAIPTWAFLRAIDFMNDLARHEKLPPQDGGAKPDKEKR